MDFHDFQDDMTGNYGSDDDNNMNNNEHMLEENRKMGTSKAENAFSTAWHKLQPFCGEVLESITYYVYLDQLHKQIPHSARGLNDALDSAGLLSRFFSHFHRVQRLKEAPNSLSQGSCLFILHCLFHLLLPVLTCALCSRG